MLFTRKERFKFNLDKQLISNPQIQENFLNTARSHRWLAHYKNVPLLLTLGHTKLRTQTIDPIVAIQLQWRNGGMMKQICMEFACVKEDLKISKNTWTFSSCCTFPELRSIPTTQSDALNGWFWTNALPYIVSSATCDCAKGPFAPCLPFLRFN